MMKSCIAVFATLLCFLCYADNQVTTLPRLDGGLQHTQYAGYVSAFAKPCLTTNCNKESGLFYWFVVSQPSPHSPLILWNNGGPGYSSTYGYFLENGPYRFTADSYLVPREYAWSNFANYLIMDNPLGVGLSFADSNQMPSNVTQAVDQLFNALIHFFEQYPNYRQSPLFLSGESYAGTTVPLLAEKIVQYNEHAKNKINLRGLILVSPWADPAIQQSKNADYAYSHGLINKEQYQEVEKLYKICNEKIQQSKPTSKKANDACGAIGNYIEKISGISLTNIMVKESDTDMVWVNYMNRADVRDALHAKKDGMFAAWSNSLYERFAMGMQDSYRTVYEYLLTKKIPILIFSGLDDGKDTNFMGVHEFIEQLQWPGKKRYEHASTLPWSTPDTHEVVAYTKSGGLLTWAKTRKAGHMVPLDQPKIALLVEQYVKSPPKR